MSIEDRRRFIGMSLAVAGSVLAVRAGAGSASADASSTSAAAKPVADPAAEKPTYLVVYRHGPRWDAAKPMAEQQGMREHFAYYVDLFRKGQLRSGGGFADNSGGAAVLEAADDDAAAAIIAGDPAVKSEVFSGEVKRWRQNRWADISKARAARGL